MMFNIVCVLKHEEAANKPAQKQRGKSVFKGIPDKFFNVPKEKMGKTRHHNVMLELDGIKSTNE
jgi:hypothetical protein